MREVRSEIEIDAPAQRVWDVLARFEDYPAWNPFIRSLKGELRTNAKVRITVQPPGKRAMTYAPRLVAVDAPRELR